MIDQLTRPPTTRPTRDAQRHTTDTHTTDTHTTDTHITDTHMTDRRAATTRDDHDTTDDRRNPMSTTMRAAPRVPARRNPLRPPPPGPRPGRPGTIPRTAPATRPAPVSGPIPTDRPTPADRPGLVGRRPALLPCKAVDPELFFAETPADVEFAKALCVDCPMRLTCLAEALDRREPCGVWGGELFDNGSIVPRKRPRGRPRRSDAERDALWFAQHASGAVLSRGRASLSDRDDRLTEAVA